MNHLSEKMEEARSAPKPEGPTETHVWYYNLRDLLDETIIGVIILTAITVLCVYLHKNYPWIWGLEIVPLIYVFWLLYTVFVRRMCTVYKLTPQNFIYQRGFFVQNTIYIELFDIEQVNLKRNLWERIIGVGTIRLKIKKIPLQALESNNVNINVKIGQDGRGTSMEISIPGMSDFENIRQLIDTYRLFVRQHRGVVITSSGG